MSIPGETPNPYGPPQQPQPPQPGAPAPQHNPYAQGPQQGQSPQQSPYPYAQPTMPAMPAVTAMPPGPPGPPGAGGWSTPETAAGAGYGPMGTQQPMPPAGPGGTGGRGGGKGWVWALGGAVVASAVWAGVVFSTGGFGSTEKKADLGSYQYAGNLCTSSDFSPIENASFKEKDSTSGANPQHSSSEDPAMDSMTCNVDYEPSSSSSGDYSSAWLYTTAYLHRKTDPAPEFKATYMSYKNQKTSSTHYKVSKVSGVGDEAYVVAQEYEGTSNTSAYVILGVRDGWMTYQTTWSQYASSSSDSPIKSNSEITEMLKESAKGTLEKLQK
ncbi:MULTISPECIES: hypothetical protein [unclassified Streptomyces]|uniref:hypothetical protein n=1 Tax=unclassified Streptomyces TaxID=2593676 RepID=UPI00336A3732